MDGDCNHEIQRHLLLGRKVVTNLDGVLKSKDITLTIKVCIVKTTFFVVFTSIHAVVMYGCESFTIKKASAEELMFLYCGVGEDSREYLGLQGDQTIQSYRKLTLDIYWKD